MEDGIDSRARAISESLTDAMGYINAGGIQWGRRAIASVKGEANFDKVYGYIKAEHERSTVIDIIENHGDRLIGVYTQSENKKESVMEEFGLNEVGAEIICRILSNSLILKDAKEIVESLSLTVRTVVFGRGVDREIIEFAKAYNDSKTPTKDTGTLPPEMLSGMCNRVNAIAESDMTDEEKNKSYDQLFSFLKKDHGKNLTHGNIKSMLMNECAKCILECGIVPHEDYRDWADQALAMAFMWRKNRAGIKWAVKDICHNLHALSHFNEYPTVMIDKILAKVERAVRAIAAAEVPLGLVVRDKFLSMKYCNEKYFFNITARLSEITGRRGNKKRVRKIDLS